MTTHTPPKHADLYRAEPTATAIATAELIHSCEFDLAGYVVESTDPVTLLEGFTNALALSVQLIARYGGVPEEDVFDLIRGANNLVEGVSGRPIAEVAESR